MHGGHVVQASAIDGLEQYGSETIDYAILQSFLEHESQPLALLQRLKKALRPAGAIVVKVPNFACWNRHLRGKRWCGFRFPDHVNYFTPRTLILLAESAGLKVVGQSLKERFPLSDNMYAVLQHADA